MDAVDCLAFTICKNTRHHSLDIPANLAAAHIWFISVYKMLRQFEILSRILAHLLLFRRQDRETKGPLPSADEGYPGSRISLWAGSATKFCISIYKNLEPTGKIAASLT